VTQNIVRNHFLSVGSQYGVMACTISIIEVWH